MTLLDQIKQLVHPYRRKGGKGHRKEQVGRMLAFGEFAGKKGARSMGQVGAGHAIGFWKTNRHLSNVTLRSYWYALCVLWELAGKNGQPPKPFYKPTTLEPPLVSAEPLLEHRDDQERITLTDAGF
jgi:hypothetical protein